VGASPGLNLRETCSLVGVNLNLTRWQWASDIHTMISQSSRRCIHGSQLLRLPFAGVCRERNSLQIFLPPAKMGLVRLHGVQQHLLHGAYSIVACSRSNLPTQTKTYILSKGRSDKEGKPSVLHLSADKQRGGTPVQNPFALPHRYTVILELCTAREDGKSRARRKEKKTTGWEMRENSGDSSVGRKASTIVRATAVL
jgi:hypothetical protein